MKERVLNAIALALAIALLLTAFVVGCRALRDNPRLWVFASVGVQSPRGTETFGTIGGLASVPLAWNGSSGAAGYRVYYRTATEPTYTRYQDAGTNLALRLIGLERKTSYRFVARAYRGDGYESGPSNEVSYRTASSPSWK